MTDTIAPEDQLDGRLLHLAKERRNIEEQKTTIAALEIELEATELFKSVRLAKEQLAALTEGAKNTDADVRGLALTQYARNPDAGKQINPYISITENTIYNFHDEEAAVRWAAEHAQNALRLDKVAIKKIAKVLPVSGITLDTENRVRIASDLSDCIDKIG